MCNISIGRFDESLFKNQSESEQIADGIHKIEHFTFSLSEIRQELIPIYLIKTLFLREI